MRRLGLILPNWIGDAVMATPAIRAIRGAFPSARIIGIGRGPILDTLSAAPWFDGTITTSQRGFAKAIRDFHHEKLDAAVLFPNSLRPALQLRLSGCPKLVGFSRYFRDPLLTHRLYARRDALGRYRPTPIIDDYNRLAMRLGTGDPGHRMELFTRPDDERAADRLWAQTSLDRFPQVVGLNPGGAFGSSKHYPAEYFAEVARSLALRGLGVVVLCGPDERETAIRIAALARHPGVVSASSVPPSIGLSKAIVHRLALLITTDSGPRHFAAAFDVPVVTLFGPTHIAWTETRFAKAVHLQEQVPCGPCQMRACPLKHQECMTRLSPARVATAGLELLRRHAPEIRYAG